MFQFIDMHTFTSGCITKPQTNWVVNMLNWNFYEEFEITYGNSCIQFSEVHIISLFTLSLVRIPFGFFFDFINFRLFSQLKHAHSISINHCALNNWSRIVFWMRIERRKKMKEANNENQKIKPMARSKNWCSNVACAQGCSCVRFRYQWFYFFLLSTHSGFVAFTWVLIAKSDKNHNNKSNNLSRWNM